jgi:phage terminase large subunit GpA-like protein
LWQEVRDAVFARDGYRCRQCGRITPLPVAHHEHYRDPYNPDTIITLCAHCHWVIHRPVEAFLATRLGKVIVLSLLAIGYLAFVHFARK